MSIVGIGVDVVDLARFRATLERTPSVRERLFTPAEAALSVEDYATGAMGEEHRALIVRVHARYFKEFGP